MPKESTKSRAKRKESWRKSTAMLPLLAALLTGCGASLPTLPSVVQPQIPPLPASARQNKVGLNCSPSCLENLTQWRESTREKLTNHGSVGLRAK